MVRSVLSSPINHISLLTSHTYMDMTMNMDMDARMDVARWLARTGWSSLLNIPTSLSHSHVRQLQRSYRAVTRVFEVTHALEKTISQGAHTRSEHETIFGTRINTHTSALQVCEDSLFTGSVPFR